MKNKKMWFSIIVIAFSLFLITNKTTNTTKIIGDSKYYDKNLINDAFDVIEEHFEKKFIGCTLIELRYDNEVEKIYTDIIEDYKKNNQEIIVVTSSFKTDRRGVDGSLNSNSLYTKWQWHLVRNKDKNCWEIISWGY